jgi:hypothetical protein
VGRPRSRGAHKPCASCRACLSLRPQSADDFVRFSGRSRRLPVRCLGSPNDGTCR